MKLKNHLHLVPRSKNACNYTSIPQIRLHGVVLSYVQGQFYIFTFTRWMWMVRFTPRPLHTQRKNTWYPLDRRLGGPQSRCGHGFEVKNSKLQLRIEPRTAVNPLLGFFEPISQLYCTYCPFPQFFGTLRLNFKEQVCGPSCIIVGDLNRPRRHWISQNVTRQELGLAWTDRHTTHNDI